MPATTETVAYGTASFVVAFTTFPVTSRFCACTGNGAQRDSNVAAYHEPLDIIPPGRAGNVGRPTLWLVSGLRDPAMAGRRPGGGAARVRAYCPRDRGADPDISLRGRGVSGGSAGSSFSGGGCRRGSIGCHSRSRRSPS